MRNVSSGGSVTHGERMKGTYSRTHSGLNQGDRRFYLALEVPTCHNTAEPLNMK